MCFDSRKITVSVKTLSWKWSNGTKEDKKIGKIKQGKHQMNKKRDKTCQILSLVMIATEVLD